MMGLDLLKSFKITMFKRISGEIDDIHERFIGIMDDNLENFIIRSNRAFVSRDGGDLKQVSLKQVGSAD